MPYSPQRRRISLQSRQCLALVLAGGKGSRLAPLTDTRCKPAVPFGGRYRLIDFALSNTMNAGIRSVGLLTQYLPNELIDHCQMTWGWAHRVFGDVVMPLPASTGPGDSGWYTGTADAIYQQSIYLKRRDFEYVVILSGDHIYKMDYSYMLESHINSKADITIGVLGVPLKEASRFGVLSMDANHNITEFVEKPSNPKPDPTNPSQALVSMGIYIFGYRLMWDLLAADHANPDSSHDFGKDVIPKACGELTVKGYRFEENETGVQRYWRDVGTLESYYDANMDLVGVKPELNLYDHVWPIWSYQEPAPAAKFTFNDPAHGCGSAVDSLVSPGCIVTGSVENSLLFDSCRVHRYSLVDRSLLLPHVHIGEHCTVRRAIIDAETHIPDNTEIGVNLERDREHFTVTENDLVVVTPKSMIEFEKKNRKTGP